MENLQWQRNRERKSEPLRGKNAKDYNCISSSDRRAVVLIYKAGESIVLEQDVDRIGQRRQDNGNMD